MKKQIANIKMTDKKANTANNEHKQFLILNCNFDF